MTDGHVSRYISFRFFGPRLTPAPDGVERFLIGPGLSADGTMRVEIGDRGAARIAELRYKETAPDPDAPSFSGYRALYDAVLRARQDVTALDVRRTSWGAVAEAMADNVEHYVRRAAALLAQKPVALNGAELDSRGKLDELDRVLALMPFGVRAKLTVADESRSDSDVYFEDTEPVLPWSELGERYRNRLLECLGAEGGDRAGLVKRITDLVSSLGQEREALDIRHGPEAALSVLDSVPAPGPADGEPVPGPEAGHGFTALVDALVGAPDQRAGRLRSFLGTAGPEDRERLVAAVQDHYGGPAGSWSAVPWLLCLVGEDRRLDELIAWEVSDLVRRTPTAQPGTHPPPPGVQLLGWDLDRMEKILDLLDRAVGDAEVPREMPTVLSSLFGSGTDAELDRAEREHRERLSSSSDGLVRAKALRVLLNDEGEKAG
ncbi:hypothetical protein ACFYW6_16790 [Streptomyces sp. NPDC002659]|uniref:hypothetical protein n=1 Tax=Streptomyces sp. NPDC002659 TaxID=3364656 RepID=UPI003690D2DA